MYRIKYYDHKGRLCSASFSDLDDLLAFLFEHDIVDYWKDDVWNCIL